MISVPHSGSCGHPPSNHRSGPRRCLAKTAYEGIDNKPNHSNIQCGLRPSAEEGGVNGTSVMELLLLRLLLQ
ncbi:hypothetical protein KIN20_033140 [Parelaphostrongylus tenuis]|uniref:Uncharacterized protein n=1 Tax=Parelaphostrongylus tenuis TaxID=148309 RepID=A0AAD5R7K1_PARTN|nr:hypothetical protein KIN20_033140 [Parelaphostrongylus tenuis]